MSIMRNRFIFSDNTVLKDFSVNLDRFISGTENIPFVAAEDFIFIGSELPFNHRWFEISAFNANASKIKIDLWDGEEWNAAVDIIDQTSVGGISLAKSGIISWVLDKDESWGKEDTVDSNDLEDVIGLGGVKIFDMYWARISFVNDLSGATALKYVGHKFSEEDDLRITYPELVLSNAKDQFETGKTDWIEQEFKAADDVIRELKARNIVVSKNQILNWEVFREASVERVAYLIYRGFGSAFNEEKRSARSEFIKAIDKEILQIDGNRNARIDSNERFKPLGLLHR